MQLRLYANKRAYCCVIFLLLIVTIICIQYEAVYVQHINQEDNQTTTKFSTTNEKTSQIFSSSDPERFVLASVNQSEIMETEYHNYSNGITEDPIEEQNTKVTIPKPNILLIIADDMRPEMGVYISERRPWLYPKMQTPNLDKLAKESLLLTSAYCQQPLCNPSRVSLLTSRRPDTTGVVSNSYFFRSQAPRVKTIGEYFKDNGYTTMAMGKVFHPLGTCDERLSWTTDCFLPSKGIDGSVGGWKAFSKEQHQTTKLMDEHTLQFASRNLEQLAKVQKPFLVAMGIKKPHTPFVFPEEFLELYPEAEMPANPFLPKNVPVVAWNHKHVRDRKENFNTSSEPVHGMSDHETKEMRRAYYATISYVDSIVGKVMDKVDALQLTNNTIVVFLSDHAIHLGEHGIFGKKTNFLVNAQVPFMIRVPGVTDKGIVSDNLVELLDLFPTLVDLTELPKLDPCPEQNSKDVAACTEGVSLLPLFNDPDAAKWRNSVRYQYPNTGRVDSCMGYSLLTKEYRLTQWMKLKRYNTTIDWNEECATELYDLQKDVRETENIADDDEYQDIVKSMKMTLRQGWKKSLSEIKT